MNDPNFKSAIDHLHSAQQSLMNFSREIRVSADSDHSADIYDSFRSGNGINWSTVKLADFELLQVID